MIYPRGSMLDSLLKMLAQDTWENLREAKLLSVRFGEETITDLLLLELRRKGFIGFRQTGLHHESKYGTDFECWVGSDDSGWVGYAVQAKKLDFGTGTYRNLGHMVKGAGKRQIDILKTYATSRGLIPRYCLYSHSPHVAQSFLHCCSRDFLEEELGCTLTPPSVIERAIASRGGKRFETLQSDSDTVPWRCLAICPRLEGSLISNSTSSDLLSPLLDKDSTIHRRLPKEVFRLREEGRKEFSIRSANNLSRPFNESTREVDFEQLDIGVDSRQMDYGDAARIRVVVPKRVYILEMSYPFF